MGSSDELNQASSNVKHKIPVVSERRPWHKTKAYPDQLIAVIVKLNVDVVLQNNRSRPRHPVIVGLSEALPRLQ